MSFVSVLKTIAHVVTEIVVPLEPAIALAPGGAEFNTIFNAVSNLEQIFEGTSKTGDIKKAGVLAIVKSAHPALPSDAVSALVDQIVAAVNSIDEAREKLASLAAAEVQSS